MCAYKIQYSHENEYSYEKVLLKVAQNVITNKKYTFLHGNWIITFTSLSYLILKKAYIFVCIYTEKCIIREYFHKHLA